MTDTHWPDYYKVTAERPAWGTVTQAAEAFPDLPAGCVAAAGRRPRLRGRTGRPRAAAPRLARHRRRSHAGGHRDAAGAHAGRAPRPPGDARGRRGRLRHPGLRPRQRQPHPALPARGRLRRRPGGASAIALAPGGRFSGMLFGDRDQAASDEPDMTCPSPEVIRAHLAGFAIERWDEKEEDGHTALGRAPSLPSHRGRGRPCSGGRAGGLDRTSADDCARPAALPSGSMPSMSDVTPAAIGRAHHADCARHAHRAHRARAPRAWRRSWTSRRCRSPSASPWRQAPPGIEELFLFAREAELRVRTPADGHRGAARDGARRGTAPPRDLAPTPGPGARHHPPRRGDALARLRRLAPRRRAP